MYRNKLFEVINDTLLLVLSIIPLSVFVRFVEFFNVYLVVLYNRKTPYGENWLKSVNGYIFQQLLVNIKLEVPFGSFLIIQICYSDDSKDPDVNPWYEQQSWSSGVGSQICIYIVKYVSRLK